MIPATFLIKFSWLAGVASQGIGNVICYDYLTKGLCPNHEPDCDKFCKHNSYPKGGKCIRKV